MKIFRESYTLFSVCRSCTVAILTILSILSFQLSAASLPQVSSVTVKTRAPQNELVTVWYRIPKNYHPRLNQSLFWGMLLLYLGLIVFLSLGHFHWKRAAIAASAALLMPVSLFLFSSENTPEVIKGEFLRLPGTSASLALYDKNFSLRECASLLPDGGILPIHSAELRSDTPFPNSSHILLFGECAHFASRYPNATVTLIAPPPHFILTDNIRQLLLKPYAENNLLELQAEAQSIPCDIWP